MSDFFDLPSTDFVKKNTTERTADPNIYNPDPNAFNGSYKSVFRFLPYIHDKTMSKYTKYSAKFWNPLTKESLFIDCPSNDKKPSILWDIETVIRSLEKEEPELYKKLKDAFGRWHTNISPVYIKKDPQRPELEGQVRFFKYAVQVNNIIEEQINPEENELVDNIVSVNPFHLLEGKDFLCVVGKKTKSFRDWTKCKFMDEVTPFIFKIGDKTVAVENSPKSIKLVQEFLKKNTPKLEEYLHKPWDESTFNKVAEAIVSLIQPRPVLDMVLARTKDDKMKELILSKLDKTAPSTSTAPDIEFKSETKATIDEPLDPVAPTDTKVEETKSETPTGEKDEYDKLFDDL